MVLERPEPGETVWRCRNCGKVYKTEEIDASAPTCRDLACHGPLEQTRH